MFQTSFQIVRSSSPGGVHKQPWVAEGRTHRKATVFLLTLELTIVKRSEILREFAVAGQLWRQRVANTLPSRSRRLMATASLKLLCLYALLRCTALWVDARQQPFVGDNNDATLGTIITPAVSHFVSDVTRQAQIPGLSMGVVRLGADQEAIVELATWGNQTEEDNGEDMKPNVSLGAVRSTFYLLSKARFRHCLLWHHVQRHSWWHPSASSWTTTLKGAM